MLEEFNLTEMPKRAKYDRPSTTEVLISIYYGVLLAGVGVAYLIGGAARFANRSLTTAATIAPFWTWGMLFLLIGLLIVVSFRLMWHWVPLGLGGFFYAFFALLYVFSAIEEDRASYAAAWIAVAISAGLLISSWRRRSLSIKREMENLTPAPRE